MEHFYSQKLKKERQKEKYTIEKLLDNQNHKK